MSTKPKIIIFDCETQKSATQVGGWHNCDKMLISVVVTYDNHTNGYKIYFEDRLDELLEAFKKADLIVSFNGDKFDLKVLAHYDEEFEPQYHRTFDMLEAVRKQVGYRIKLDYIAQGTLNSHKSAGGLDAIKWYRQGRMDKIVEYCIDDVKLTKDIFYFAVEHKYLYYIKNRRKKRILTDWVIEELL